MLAVNITAAQSKFFPLAQLPDLHFQNQSSQQLTDSLCYKLWQKYNMPSNICDHSLLVAHISETIAKRAQDHGYNINVDLVRQSALLHDLGKAYSLEYGGSHAMLGAAWVVAETGNYVAAQGVMHHVYWPWALPDGENICSLPLIVLYADKRAKHAECVTLEERAKDLYDRYGHDEISRQFMSETFQQIRQIETRLSKCLAWEDLNAYTFDSRGMVN